MAEWKVIIEARYEFIVNATCEDEADDLAINAYNALESRGLDRHCCGFEVVDTECLDMDESELYTEEELAQREASQPSLNELAEEF